MAAVAADQSGSEGPFLRLIKMSEWSNHKTYTIAITNCCYAHMQTNQLKASPQQRNVYRMPPSNREIFEVGDDASEAEVDEIDDFDCCERG